VYILDQGKAGASVRQVSSSGIITTLLAAAPANQTGAVANPVYGPTGIAVNPAGTLFIAEETLLPPGGPVAQPFRIQEVLQGVVTTFVQAGGGPIGFDASGNLFVVDPSGLQRITPDGSVSTLPLPVSGTIGSANALAVGPNGNVYVGGEYSVLMAQPTTAAPVISPVTVSAVFDAASESAGPISPGKIIVIYGSGLGSPLQAGSNQPSNGIFGTSLNGTTVTFGGIAAPILYESPTQIIAVAPYEITGSSAHVVVSYQGQSSKSSTAFSVPIAGTAPSLFTSNQTGAGEAAAVNDIDGTLNSAVNPVKIGGYISLFATGEGQTSPVGVDGKLGGTVGARPLGNVSVTVGGINATVQYAGGIAGDVAGLMQVNVQIPAGVQPGGYVPVVLQVGNASSNLGTWIAVAGN